MMGKTVAARRIGSGGVEVYSVCVSACDVKGEEVANELNRFGRYLSVGSANHDLLMKHAALRSKSSDTEPLQTLFPRLVLLSLRNPELQRAKDIPSTSSPPPSAFGFEITKTTKIAVHVYRSITPSDLLSACVIGTHRRETACAMNTFRSASGTHTSRFLSFGVDAGVEVGDARVEVENAGVEGDLHDETLCDNIYRISFAPRARFLAENVEAEERTIPMARSGTAGSGHLVVDGSTLNNDDSPGSRSRDIARGLLGVLPSQRANEDMGTVRKRAVGQDISTGSLMVLPLIAAQADHATYKPLVKEMLAHLPVKAALHITQDHCHDLADFSEKTKNIAAVYREKWQESALLTSSAGGPFFQLIRYASDFCNKTRYQAVFQVNNRSPHDGYAERGFVVTEIIERHGTQERLSTFYPAAFDELPTEMIVAAPL